MQKGVVLLCFLVVSCTSYMKTTSGRENRPDSRNCSGNPEDENERGCPLGWMSYKNHCYMIVSKPSQSWFNANIQCENQNSTLAKLDSRSEIEWIYQRILARNEPVNFWIGGNRLKRFEEWRWVSDGQRIEFFDFYKTQPNQASSLCIVLWKAFKYDWADEPCTSSYGYICKI